MTSVVRKQLESFQRQSCWSSLRFEMLSLERPLHADNGHSEQQEKVLVIQLD